jgi:hypothetical protein
MLGNGRHWPKYSNSLNSSFGCYFAWGYPRRNGSLSSSRTPRSAVRSCGRRLCTMGTELRRNLQRRRRSDQGSPGGLRGMWLSRYQILIAVAGAVFTGRRKTPVSTLPTGTQHCTQPDCAADAVCPRRRSDRIATRFAAVHESVLVQVFGPEWPA